MSAEYYSRLVFGYRFDNVEHKTKVRGCDHPESKSKHCPECGKAMWETETVELSCYIDDEFYGLLEKEKWVFEIEQDCGTDGEPLFIGAVQTCDDYHQDILDVSDFINTCKEHAEELKTIIKRFADQHLADFNLEIGEPKFWLVQYCSC